MLYKFRLKLSYYLIKLGVSVLPDDIVKLRMKQSLGMAGNMILEDLSSEP